MRKCVGLTVVVALAAIAIVAPRADAVPLFKNVPNTFIGGGVAENAGYNGAPAGTQAAFWNYAGSEVSLSAGGAAINLPQASPGGPGAPAAAIMETTLVKDGSSISFGQELTAVLGGLFPTGLLAIGALDNGLAPGSAVDGRPDQLPSGVLASYKVLFGPGTLANYQTIFGGLPVFEIYEDVPPVMDLDIGTGSTNLEEMHMDFDGAGPAVPPPTPVPSQFINTGAVEVASASAPNQVAYATNGGLFASGWIDTLIATYTFFDPTVLQSGYNATTQSAVYSVQILGKGVVTDGSILSLLDVLEPGGAYDGSDINITFAATLFGRAYVAGVNGLSGQDGSSGWNLSTTLAANSGDASFTIIPVPEPSTMVLLGLSLVPAFLARRKRRA